MLREQRSLILDFEKLLDITITAFSFIAAYFIKRHLVPSRLAGLSTDPNYYLILTLIIISWYIAFKWMNMYMSYRERPFWQFFTCIVKSNLLGMLLLTIIMYVMHIHAISRLLMGIFIALNIGLLTLSKFIIFTTLEKLRTDGLNTRSVLIIGSKERAREVIRAVEKYKASGYRVAGCFDINEDLLGQTVENGHKVIGLVGDLEAYLRHNIVDELIFAMPLKMIQRGDRYLALAESMGIKVRIIPDWEIHYLMYRPNIAAIRFESFLGVYNMVLQSTPANEGKILIKHVAGYMTAMVLTLVLMPVFIAVAVAIKRTSPGPVFYTQERLGLNGRKFKLYKFRTMVNNADEIRKELEEMNEMDGPVFKIKDDPRIIPGIGQFLRKTSLDELPQLFNVLRGEMCLVGPRPPLSKEVDEYSVRHRRRLSMKPGMTCLWQIAPNRNDLSFEEWMNLDLKYIDNWSLFNDVKILVLTARAVLTRSGR
ncbi:sugar transferase [Desulfobacter sp.]|uniref:sugar transferase n=1 Tax=Desulfobacter sp. TaxID=2294 RepID=UPI000E88AD89|nr:sugar transferase [Desulfobacter sp.]HBT88707.1 sugar transferase [Desulfobacter sp.]